MSANHEYQAGHAIRHAAIAHGRAFAHLTVAMLDRRSAAIQHAAGELALGFLEAAFGASGLDCDLTVEVREIRAAGYFKKRS